jgi:hypothetical protein
MCDCVDRRQTKPLLAGVIRQENVDRMIKQIKEGVIFFNNATPTDTIYGKILRANSMQAKHENHGPIFQHQILKSTNPLPTRQSLWFL